MRISRASAEIYGLSSSTMEITADDWHARVHRDDMQRVRAEHIRALKERQHELVCEFRYVRPGGEARWIEARSLVAYDDAGRAERMTGVYIDVTERKQAEAVLRESETRLADALTAGQVIAFEWDAVTRQSRRSGNAALILGCGGRRDVRDLQCDHSFFRRVHPDDRECFKAYIRALCPDNPSYALSFRFRSPDGRLLWLEETAKGEFNAAGRLLRIKGLTRNITDRKNAERALAERNMQFSLAGRAALVGSFVMDFETEEVRFSDGYAVIHGLPEGTSHTTRSKWKVGVHPDDLGRVDELRDRAFREQRGEYGFEYRRVVRSTGEVRWIEARCFASYGSDGRPQRVVGVDIDVTARRRAEEHQRILIAELDHRVKNVLACVAAVAQQSRECSRSADEFLKVLNGRIDSLANAHALLSRSRWEGVGLGELVRSELARCVSNGNHLIEGPDIVLAAEATQPLAMVLHELTTNATKYGALSSRDGRVSVYWERQSGCNSHDHLALEWRETGGPPIVVPGPSGYGSSVIRDLIPYELGGSVDYVLAPEGVSCRVEIPAKWLRDGLRKSGGHARTARHLHGVS
jgi:PAS domain S-box-containing protein